MMLNEELSEAASLLLATEGLVVTRGGMQGEGACVSCVLLSANRHVLHALLSVLSDADNFPSRNSNSQLALMGFSYPMFPSLN